MSPSRVLIVLSLVIAAAACGDSSAPAQPDAAEPACVPSTCESRGAGCGTLADDGCGGTLECGTCDAPATCGGQGIENVCAIPAEQRACTSGWCWEAPAPMPFDSRAMFALAPTDVWAIGSAGVVLHFDGTSWRNVPANTTADLNGIWMASASDGWIVGEGGVIRRWNGTAWTTVTSGTTATLRGVHGQSAANVWIVGDAVALRWTGSSLVTPSAASTPNLNDVLVSATNVFAVGEDKVWSYTGTSWSAQTPGLSAWSCLFSYCDVVHIAGTATKAFAVGSPASKWDGQSWTAYSQDTYPFWHHVFADGDKVFGVTNESFSDLDGGASRPGPDHFELRAMTGVSGQQFAATHDGQLWRRSQGVWNTHGYGSRDTIYAIGEVGDSLWFAGAGGLQEWRGGLLPHPMPTTDPPTREPIVAVGGASRDDLWIAAFDGLFHYDGRTWREESRSIAPNALYAKGGEVVVVGDDGQICHKTSTDWACETVGSSHVRWDALDDLSGDLYVVGYEGYPTELSRVARRTGGTWVELPQPDVMVRVIAVAGPDDIWVAGSDSASVPHGKVSHWNGSTWMTTTIPGMQYPSAIEVVAGEVSVTGYPSGMHRRATDGTWTVERPVTNGMIRALHATATDLWAAGDNGAVLRR